VKQIFKSLSLYGIAYLVLLMYVLGLLYAYPKVELHLWLNSWHTDLLDTFFKYYSMMAEWPFYVLGLLPLLWRKKGITLFYAVCELCGGVVVQILKHLFSAPRPIMVFENYPDLVLPLVEGVNLHHSNSFPSGHTSTFFMFFTCCAIILAYYQGVNDMMRLLRKPISLFAFSCIVSIGTLLLYNLPFFNYVVNNTHEDTFGKIFLTASLVVVMLVVNFMMTCLVMYFLRKAGRILLALLAIINAVAVYFILTYSIIIDEVTIGNVFNTRYSEASGFFSWSLWLSLGALCLLPALYCRTGRTVAALVVSGEHGQGGGQES